MKKLMIIAACLAVLFSLSACVPTERNNYEVGPDLTPNENVEYDFTQIHNETLSMLEGKPQYQFITDVVITGSNEEKKVYVRVTCLDEANEEMAAAFASALLRSINDSALTQDMTVSPSDSGYFGSFWDKFGVQIDVYTESEAQKSDGVPLYSLNLDAGESCGLDPDIEAYEEEWYRQMNILIRNAE